MAVARNRVQDLIKLQCSLYNQSYNPSCIRTGNWVLRQKLKGPSLVNYYPPRAFKVADLHKAFQGWETYDEHESERFDSLAIMKARGKGAPKKKRTAEEGRAAKGKKRK